jgi:putative oxidoreductase
LLEPDLADQVTDWYTVTATASPGAVHAASAFACTMPAGRSSLVHEPSDATARRSLPASERHNVNGAHRAGPANRTTLPSAGVLLLRVIVGVTFVAHGLDKLADLSSAAQFFASLDIPAPGLMAPFVAVTETVGGVLLIAGLATPLVGAALATDMLVALLTAHLGQGFFARDGGIELPLLLGGASVAIALTGAGRFSLDASFELPQRFLQRVSRLAPLSGLR